MRARDVAQEVGCALGAIYGVFADLDALILAVKDRALDTFEAQIAQNVQPDERMPEDQALCARAAEASLQKLAGLYLGFARQYPKLWQAVFEHRSPDPIVPGAYMEKLDGVLRHVERPLEILTPRLAPSDRQLWARALFSAVHGVVALGLDQKLGPLSAESLKWQVHLLVRSSDCRDAQAMTEA